MDDLKLAFIAGFFDGEGTIGAISPNGSIALSVGQVDPKPLLLMQGVLGGSVRPSKRRSSARSAYTWRQNGRKALVTLRLILPYLVVKRGQAELAIQLQMMIGPPHRSLGGAEQASWIMAERLSFVGALKESKTFEYDPDGTPTTTRIRTFRPRDRERVPVSSCVRGHSYTEENTYWRIRGAGRARQCRTCRREQNTARRAKASESTGYRLA